MRRKIVNEEFHRRVPESVEAEEVHFFQGLFRGPFFDGHAVSGDKHAGTIIAEAAVHEYFLLRIIAEHGEKLRDLIVGRRSPATDGNMDEAYSERFSLPALPYNFPSVFAAQIDDCSNPQLLQFRKAALMWLRATIQRIVDLAGIRNSRELQFFAECPSFGWRRRRTCLRLRKKR